MAEIVRLGFSCVALGQQPEGEFLSFAGEDKNVEVCLVFIKAEA